jgi:hypothetical protein
MCPASLFAEKLSFVSGHRFSDTVSASEPKAPLGAVRQSTSFSAFCSAAPQLGFGKGTASAVPYKVSPDVGFSP